MVSISICMIVKNEEMVLKRCLDSIRDIADEIIIVDTGSTDRTKEIAYIYTDKVYDFEWINDFAAARNYSFSKATKDYIYAADADEMIDEENYRRFLKLKQELIPEVEIVQMMYANQLEYNTTYNFDMEYRPKLFKRLRSFSWVDPVHESVLLKPVVYDSDIVIIHKPTSNHASRDFSIFQRVIRSGRNLSDKLYEMYAKELYISGKEKDFIDALDYFEKVTENDCNERQRKIYECILTKGYRLKNDINGIMKYSLKNLAEGKASAEVCFELGEYYFGICDYKEAIVWYYNAAYETESELNIRYSGDIPLNRLADCYHMLKDLENEEIYRTYCETWLKENMG